MFIVYQIKNVINGKSYIGFTTQPVEKRWREHQDSSRNPKVHFHRAIRKYGAENFSVKIWEMGENGEYGKKVAEPMYIAWLKPEYNKTLGGDGKLGYKWSEEGKEKLRQGTLEYFKKPGTLEKHRLAMWGSEVKAERVKTLFGRTWVVKNKHKYPVIECPHCLFIGGGGNMKRYHFGNCKQLR